MVTCYVENCFYEYCNMCKNIDLRISSDGVCMSKSISEKKQSDED